MNRRTFLRALAMIPGLNLVGPVALPPPGVGPITPHVAPVDMHAFFLHGAKLVVDNPGYSMQMIGINEALFTPPTMHVPLDLCPSLSPTISET